MMRALRLAAFEVRAQARTVVPSPAARVAIVMFCVAWMTVFSYAVAVTVRVTPASRAHALVPLMALFAGTALMVAMAAIGRTMERPERFAAWRLAPVPPAWAVAIPLGAAAVLTSGVTLAIATPAIVAAAAGHILEAVFVAMLATITALWILVVAIRILAGMASRRGVDAAARLGRTSVAPIAALMIVALRLAAEIARQVDQVVFGAVWLASAAMLPAAIRATASNWAAALAMGAPRRISRPPQWGSPSWGRMLRRTPLAWSMLGVLPLVVSASTTTLRVAAMFALIVPTSAMFHLMRWEDDCPDRQKLAPAGRRLRFTMWLHVGAPASLVASLAGVLILQDLQRVVVFVAATWAGPLLYLWSRQKLRASAQIVVLLTAAIFLMAASSAGAQVRPGPVSEARTKAAIRGTVRAAHTGVALARARVRLVAIADRQVTTVAADGRGAFEFIDLKPGRYQLSASKGGYVQMQFGQRRALVPGSTIELEAGDEIDRLDIHLPPGAAIEGRVLDEFGEPVVDAVVMTLRSQFAGGRKRLGAAGRVLTTDDQGEFRLFGLPPGTYYLSAALMTGQNAGDASGREGYAPTYFPGTVDLAAAQPIVLEEGEQRKSADVVLSLVKTASVAGATRDSQGRAFASGSVSAVNVVGGFPMPVASAAIAGDGSFRLSNVPPGVFTIVASTPAGADGSRQMAVQRLSISGEDVAGLVLAAPQPSTVAGIIERDSTDSDPLPPFVQLRLTPADPIEDAGESGWLVRTNPDRSFNSSVRPGNIRVEMVNAPGWFVSRVLQGGRDVTDTGILVTAGEAAADVQVVLTRRVTTVTGDVVDSSRQPSYDYTVVAFVRDRALWTFRSRHVAAARPDQHGSFTIRGLPAGDYLIAAIDHVEQGESHDVEFLDGIRDRAQPVSLDAGQPRRITLPLLRRP